MAQRKKAKKKAAPKNAEEQQTLNDLLESKGLMNTSELLLKDLEFQNRPHGHDH